MAPLDWVLVVLTGIGGVFGLCCLFDGARRIVLYGPNPASRYLIGVGAAICLMLAAYAYWKSEQVEAHFVEFVMWLVWGTAALVFGALFAREPVPPASSPKPAVGEDTVPLPKPVIPPAPAKPADKPPPPPAALPKPAVGEDTVPLPKPKVGVDTVPLPKPGIPPAPLARSSVGEDTVPIAKPAPGTLKPPPKKP